MIKYTILVDGKWYEKYSSTARTFGGSLVLTQNKREAKLITRYRDAKYRLSSVEIHLFRSYHFPALHKRYGLSNKPPVEILEIEV